jgi:hypothetical protein
MEIQQIRRARLAQLIQERYEGSQAKYVDETGENQGEVSGLLRSKSFGERKARKLEAKSNLPVGWLDRLDEEPARAAELNTIRPGPALRIVETVEQQWMALVYVTQRELDLLTMYRRAPDVGKGLVEIAAQSAAGEELGAGTAHQS